MLANTKSSPAQGGGGPQDKPVRMQYGGSPDGRIGLGTVKVTMDMVDDNLRPSCAVQAQGEIFLTHPGRKRRTSSAPPIGRFVGSLLDKCQISEGNSDVAWLELLDQRNDDPRKPVDELKTVLRTLYTPTGRVQKQYNQFADLLTGNDNILYLDLYMLNKKWRSAGLGLRILKTAIPKLLQNHGFEGTVLLVPAMISTVAEQYPDTTNEQVQVKLGNFYSSVGFEWVKRDGSAEGGSKAIMISTVPRMLAARPSTTRKVSSASARKPTPGPSTAEKRRRVSSAVMCGGRRKAPPASPTDSDGETDAIDAEASDQQRGGRSKQPARSVCCAGGVRGLHRHDRKKA